MIFRHLLLILMLFSAVVVQAQKAENIGRIDRAISNQGPRDCNNDAGTIGLGSFIGQSERNDLQDTIFLCWLDRFFIEHNQDFDLSGDPDPSTDPGVGYAWYDGIPTITGPDLLTIESDPFAYKPSGEMVVYVDQLNGNAMFENGYYTGFTSFNEYISGGAVTQKYFSPITFDQRSGTQALYEGSPAGECVNARVDEAFTVVYLNPIEANNITTQYLGDPDRVQFTVEGGMPEFDGSDYSEISIQLKNKPSTKGTLEGNGYTHDQQVEFTVPEFGLYEIIIRDGISCEVITEVNIQEYTIPTFVLDTISGQPGEIVCLTWSVKDFEEIQFIFGGIKFDPSVIQFDSYTALNFHDVILGSVIGPDQISAQWVPLNPDFYTLDDGEELAEICFEIVGDPGDCSPVFFHNTDAVYTDAFGGGDVAPNQETGLICVDPPAGLYAEIDYCGSVSGADEGTFTFQIFGGTAPFSYVLQDLPDIIATGSNIPADAGKITIFNIPGGSNYELIITDALGVTYSDDVFLPTYDNPLTIDFINVVQPTCFGDSDGAVEIEVSGGIIINPNDYSVQWSTNDFAQTTLNQLSSGTYCVTITEDFTGCEAVSCINLDVEPLDLQLAILDTAACENAGDGRISAIISGGTPELGGYNVQWKWEDDQNLFADQGYTSIYENISPGWVYVEVSDSFPYCKVADSIEMPYLYTLEALVNSHDVLCYGDTTTGSFEMLASLGDYPSPEFNFFPSVVPPFPNTASFEYIGTDSIFVDGMRPGGFVIEISETKTGCSTQVPVSISQPTFMYVDTIYTTNLGCQEGELGEATIRVRGGTKPYYMTSTSGLPDAVISGGLGTYTYNDLDTGTYYITIEDENGCITQDTFQILGMEEELRIDSLVYEAFECVPGASTDITAYATSSGLGIFYLWLDENLNVIDTDNTLEDAGAGKYYLQVSDSNGCEAMDSIELFEPDLFTLDIILTEAECAGANGGLPGSICVNPIGGTPGFSYTWTDGTPPDQNCLENIGEGSYMLEVTDINNCRVDTLITLSGPTEINVDILSLSGISCNDGQTFDGQITVSASGGDNPTNSYSYELSSGTGGFGQVHIANDLEGGQNWVLVSFNTLSGSTCYADTSYFEIEVPEVLEMDFNKVFVQDVSCFGDCDAIAIVGATGGNSSFYGFDWIDSGDSGAAVSNLCAGTYRIEITDANGCTVLDSITVNQPDSLIVYLDEDNTNGINCFGPNTGQIQIFHEGGNIGNPFTYEWTNTDATGPLATDLAEGDYSVTVTDSRGCSDEISVLLEAQEPVIAVVPDPAPIECFGGQTCITVESATGGTGPYTFSINSGLNYPLDSCISVYASDQEYLIEVFDDMGCPYSTTIKIDQPDPIEVFLGEDIEVGLGELAILNAQITADNPIQLIEWTPMGENDICVGTNCQQLEIHPSQNTTYSVLVQDINGCTGEDEIDVRINSRRNVFIPNAFSPNGDAYNERFEIITGNGVRKINYFRIYDRWGELVYETGALDPSPTGVGDWDGTYRGRKLSPAVFVYMVEVEFIDGRVIVYRGSVTLLR